MRLLSLLGCVFVGSGLAGPCWAQPKVPTTSVCILVTANLWTDRLEEKASTWRSLGKETGGSVLWAKNQRDCDPSRQIGSLVITGYAENALDKGVKLSSRFSYKGAVVEHAEHASLPLSIDVSFYLSSSQNSCARRLVRSPEYLAFLNAAILYLSSGRGGEIGRIVLKRIVASYYPQLDAIRDSERLCANINYSSMRNFALLIKNNNR